MGAQGGVGRHVVDLSYGLRKLGHDITIIHNKIVDQALKQDFQELKKFGVKSSEINFGRNISINDFITLFRILFFIIFSKKIDVIHGHSSKGGVYARIVGFFSRASIVYTPHAFYTMNTSLGTIKFNLIKYTEAFLSLFSDRIILTSKSEWDHAEALKINKFKLALIPNGAYMSPFSKIKHLRKKKFTKSIGFVGRLCFQKDPLRAVKIFSLALNMNKQLKLSILGDGEYLKSLRDLINKTDLSAKIKIIKEKNLKDFLKDIDLLLVTSRYEGSPYLFQDACMASIPIISTDVGGVEFFVKKGINGYVYSTNDEASRMINKCLKSKNFMNQISERSVKISSRYSLENMVSQTLDLYLSI
jgi:glycosyltransferase involved in cell wall biosynthesis